MPTYAVFNRKTGEIVETHHFSEDAPVSREWVFAVTNPKHNREELDITIVDPAAIEKDRSHRIDVATGKLHPAGPKQVKGFGSGGTTRGPGPARQRATRTVFEGHPAESGRK